MKDFAYYANINQFLKDISDSKIYNPNFVEDTNNKILEYKNLKEEFKKDLFKELKIKNTSKATNLFDILDNAATAPHTISYYASMYKMFSDIIKLFKC